MRQGFPGGKAKRTPVIRMSLPEAQHEQGPGNGGGAGQGPAESAQEQETRTFRLCTRVARDRAAAGMAVCAAGAVLTGAWLLFRAVAAPQDLSWLDAALPAAAVLAFSLLRRVTSCRLTVGPAGLVRGPGAGRRAVPWSSVEAVELHGLPGLRSPAPAGPVQETLLLIRMRGARCIAVRGDIDGFHDLQQMLRRHIPQERWRDRRNA